MPPFLFNPTITSGPDFGGHVNITTGHSEEINLNSALVNSATSPALVRAIQSIREDYNYYLPKEGGWDGGKLGSPPYNLEGWLKYIDRVSGIDTKEPFEFATGGMRVGLAQYVIARMGLEFDLSNGRIWRKKNTCSELFRYSLWADYDGKQDPRPNDNEFLSRGEQLIGSIDEIKKFLLDSDMDLIIDVEIRRANFYESRASYVREKKERKSHIVFLFRQNGTIENHRGNIGSW